MYPDLQDKVALVTGAGRRAGIGCAIARRLAGCGAHVVVADLGEGGGTAGVPQSGDREGVKAIAAELAATHGVRTLAMELDVTDNASIDRMAHRVRKQFGGVDILCNNAGSVFGVPNAVHTYAEEAWTRTIDVNLNGVFRVSRAMVPLMSEMGGSIINSASQAAKKPSLFNGAYAAAKAGVVMLTKVMAMELAGSGIRVNAVCPGVIMTDFTRWRFELEAEFLNATPEERMAAKCREIPLGRLGTAEEVANLVAFLASNASSYITGQALNITGGQTMEY